MDKLDMVRIRVTLGDWGELPAKFQQLSPDQQKHYLTCQGYQSFTDLLAHITAWWERGMLLIEHYRADADFIASAVDVDQFNALAVAEAHGKSEDEILKAFTESRQRFHDLVLQLDTEKQIDPRIIRQIEMELIAHYQEHKIE